MSNYTGTTLPLEAHENRSLFLEDARNIGRAYRNRALELISICQLLSQYATPRFAHEDAELRRVLRVCDLALRSAADSGTEVTDGANARFQEATQVLLTTVTLNRQNRHSERVHRLDLLPIYSRMEIAKRSDSEEGVWSPAVKHETILHQKSKDEWGPTTIINFALLRSPLLASRNPDTVIVSQEFSSRPTLPEILWNFSRYEDCARVALEENPHFYLHFPADESIYTPMFQCHPLHDFGALKHNDTVYVLFDGPGRVFLDFEHKLRIFGNVWSLNGSLIFRDRSGVLEGEQLIRGFSIRDNLRYCEQQVLFYNSEARPRFGLHYLRPIVTTSSPDRSTGMFEDWKALNRLASHFINIHIYDSRGFSGSINSLDLPPPPPTFERPGYPVLYTSFNMLEDDILLGIFIYYRLDEENAWNDRLGWCKLSHVCRRWRHLVHSSAFRLGMHILCTNGTRTVDTLDHLPTLPLFVVYLDTNATISVKDELGIYCALRLRDRVHRIDLHLPSSILHKSLILMEEPFSMLEHLSLSSATEDDTNLVLPKTFLAPNLRHLTLLGINLPKRLRLLTSTVSLATLVLTNIRASGYFLPRLLVARLQSLPQLEELSIGFSIPIPRPSAERDLLSKRRALVMLQNLKHLTFQGVGAYLECLVAQIRAPVLKQLDITLFNQIAFALPHLSHFINITEGLKLPIVEVSFGRDRVSVATDLYNTRQHSGRFALRVRCTQLDWQIDCAAQICSVLMPTVFDVEELRLKFHEQTMPTKWQDGEIDDTTWYELLRTFIGVKELHLCAALSRELSRVLQAGGVGSDPGLLPGLREIVCGVKKGDVHSLFSSFIRTRGIAGRPVGLVSAYSIKAKALYAYTAPPDMPDGISFAKDEVLEIIDMRDHWWHAQREDNTRGGP
ncbi:hypothetical protein H4582DRAFT_104166 [Lactarius indigo]|nr:hypothetical protein H4582DRAFT_104166 [Lactarius indigo]